MRLSREARILLAIVAVAAAAWIWINFYNQAEPQVAGAAPGGDVQLAEPAVPSTEPDVAATPEVETPETGAEAAEPGAEAPGNEAASGDLAAEPPAVADPEGGVAASEPGEAGGSVATEPLPAVAGRDVEVVELPFLITSPPPQDAQDDLAAAAELELSRPTSDLRVTVNPFSPILLAPSRVEASAPGQASGSGQNGTITEVAVPGGPAGSSPSGTITEVPIPGAPASNQAGISPGTITAVPVPGGPSNTQTSAAPGGISEVAVPGGPSNAPGGAVSEVAVPGAPGSSSSSPGGVSAVTVPGGPASGAPSSAVTEVPIPGAPASNQAGISPGTISEVAVPGAPSRNAPSGSATEVAVPGGPSSTPGAISEVAVPGAPGAAPGGTVSEVAVPGAPGSSSPGGVSAVDVPGGPGNSSAGSTASGAAEAAPQASAPTPEVNVPIDPLASNLPRTLPSGTLASTPEILRPSRAPALPGSAGQPNNLSQVAALSVPGGDAPPALPLSDAPIPSAPVAEADVAPLQAGVPASSGSGPMAAGTTQLSRYLRDQNYRFTGSVIGPVGVGVFRMGNAPTPVVVPLGQTLPETDIVLTSLQGKQAELTRENDTQVLVLDLR